MLADYDPVVVDMAGIDGVYMQGSDPVSSYI